MIIQLLLLELAFEVVGMSLSAYILITACYKLSSCNGSLVHWCVGDLGWMMKGSN